jgi:hypothetical protein
MSGGSVSHRNLDFRVLGMEVVQDVYIFLLLVVNETYSCYIGVGLFSPMKTAGARKVFYNKVRGMKWQSVK